MESKRGDRQKYIKRSFPVGKGTVLNLEKYGYPYSEYPSVVIKDIAEVHDHQYAPNANDVRLDLKFNYNEDVSVLLNSFTTVKKIQSHAGPMWMPPDPHEVIHTTFYLYID